MEKDLKKIKPLKLLIKSLTIFFFINLALFLFFIVLILYLAYCGVPHEHEQLINYIFWSLFGLAILLHTTYPILQLCDQKLYKINFYVSLNKSLLLHERLSSNSPYTNAEISLDNIIKENIKDYETL